MCISALLKLRVQFSTFLYFPNYIRFDTDLHLHLCLLLFLNIVQTDASTHLILLNIFFIFLLLSIIVINFGPCLNSALLRLFAFKIQLSCWYYTIHNIWIHAPVFQLFSRRNNTCFEIAYQLLISRSLPPPSSYFINRVYYILKICYAEPIPVQSS